MPQRTIIIPIIGPHCRKVQDDTMKAGMRPLQTFVCMCLDRVQRRLRSRNRYNSRMENGPHATRTNRICCVRASLSLSLSLYLAAVVVVGKKAPVQLEDDEDDCRERRGEDEEAVFLLLLVVLFLGTMSLTAVLPVHATKVCTSGCCRACLTYGL